MGRLGLAASRFLKLLPALIAALLCARIFELALALVPGGSFREVALAFELDAVALLCAVPLLFLLTLPALVVEAPRARRNWVGLLWSVVLAVQVVLMQYFLTTRVPLGADLFGYSLEEVRQTAGAGAHVGFWAVVHLALSLAVLWALLRWLALRHWHPHPAFLVAALAAGIAALARAPGQGHMADAAHADALVLDKAAYFVEDSVAWWTRKRGAAQAAVAAPVAPPTATEPIDPDYPFLHREQTPDVLGPLFRHSDTPPSLVFVIVEGLGRSFSGPGARHGSFTPFLDELAGRSLYFENFLANQGRTFAALPTIFGSLPFGDVGFAANADRQPLPPHVTLLSILGAQGYHTRFYAGFDLAFDQERPFLQRQNVESLVDLHDFGAGYARANSWGYGDGELAARALEGEKDAPHPAVVVVQTVTLHTPYTFPGQAEYAARLEHRLDELGVSADDRDRYHQQADIYTSILYTDEALRTLLRGLEATEAWPHTIVIITGDHCLPELPMATRIERYHVPLIIHSPLLKEPARIKAVSSQMDLAPSLLAYLARDYDLRTPAQVTWLGTGLDLDPHYRNVHDVPLKLGKHILADFVQGSWYFSRGQLFRLDDGMKESPVNDNAAAARVQQALERFAAANDHFASTGTLIPESALPAWVAYRDEGRTHLAPAPVSGAGVSAEAGIAVSAVHAPKEAAAGALRIGADFKNAGKAARSFVPLIVLLDATGREISETYGPLQKLTPGASATVTLGVKSQGAKPGPYFLAVVPSEPGTGKTVGTGRYHIAVRLH